MSTVKQSESADPKQVVTGMPEPSTQGFTVVSDESIADALAELDNLRTCRRLDEQTIAAQRKALVEAREYQQQLTRRIVRGSELRHKLEDRIDAFRQAIADAELGEGPAFNMREALAADDRAIESEREYLKESDRAAERFMAALQRRGLSVVSTFIHDQGLAALSAIEKSAP